MAAADDHITTPLVGGGHVAGAGGWYPYGEYGAQ